MTKTPKNSKSRKKSNSLSLLRKKEVLDLLDQGVSQRQLAKQFEISKTAVLKIDRNRSEIETAWTEGKIRMTGNDMINNKVLDFFVKCRATNIRVTGRMLQTKAKDAARHYSVDNFQASNGWLQGFLSRNNISLRVISAASAAVGLTSAAEWRIKLPYLSKGFSPENQFNANQTELFYRQASRRSYLQNGHCCAGGKSSRDRLSVLLCCSATGEKLKPLVVGNASSHLQTFNNASIDVNNLPVTWRSSRGSRMTLEIFDDWLLSINQQMQTANRKILLVVDNAGNHKTSAKLSNITIKFLPPNLTSEVQPLDQGIFRAVKARYRTKMLHYLVSVAEAADTRRDFYQSINVLHAIRWLSRAWEEVTPETIVKCFQRAGSPGSEPASGDELEEYNTLADVIDSLPPSLGSDVLTAEEMLNIDDYLASRENAPTADDVGGSVERDETASHDSECESDTDETEFENYTPILTHSEAAECIRRLIEYSSVYRPNYVDSYLRQQTDLEEASYNRITATRQSDDY